MLFAVTVLPFAAVLSLNEAIPETVMTSPEIRLSEYVTEAAGVEL